MNNLAENTVNLDLVKQLPQIVAVKDVNSVYLAMSQPLARLVGWTASDDCVGKTDYDLPCQANESAPEFISLDVHTFNLRKKILTLDMHQYKYDWKLLLAERNPIKISNSQEGVMTSAMDISNINLMKSYIALYGFDKKCFDLHKNKATTYIFNGDIFNDYNLTEKQAECLFLLIRGKSIKQIACVLGKSPRTIENHIEAIKNKFVCSSKSELIGKAIDEGFLYFLPKNLNANELDKIL